MPDTITETIDTLSDTLDLKTAAKVSGRAVSTLRSWVRAGKLGDLRTPGDRYSPVLIDTIELRGLLATMSSNGGKGNGNGKHKGTSACPQGF